MNSPIVSPSIKAVCILALLACLHPGSRALGQFTAAPTTFKVDGGWCWFQDPRAVIVSGHLVIGSVAGATVSGASTAGDETVTDYNIATGALATFVLHAAYSQDDHSSPALAVLPDNRLLVTYENHGGSNFVLWRVSTNAGNGTAWGAEQTSTVNTNGDGNGNTYNNPFYLSLPNTVYDFSRAIGYDTNYGKFIGLNSTNNAGLTNASNFAYGGHFQYWQNPGTGPLTGGNGRPYVKYTSNGTDTVWLATTEDSPQNYLNSLYVGYVRFASTGAGTVYTSTGTALGAISTGTAPTGSANPPTSGGNQGAIVSGTGYSYQPTQFTLVAKANGVVNGLDLTSASPYGAGYVTWASSMRLDTSGNPYLGFVVMRNLTGAYGNNLEYYLAHLVSGSWQISRVGYGGYALYNGQNQYSGLIAVDPYDVNRVYISTDVDPQTKANLLGSDGKQHWQIFQGVTADGGSTWGWTQLTNTSSDNIRPIVAAGSGQIALLWLQGSYASYTSYNTNVVGVVQPLPVPAVTSSTASQTKFAGASFSYQIAATNTPTSYSASGLPTGLSVNTATGLISGTLSTPGNSSITLGATNAYGTSITATLALSVVQESFAYWQSQSFSMAQLNDPTVSGLTATPAGDGIPNLLKYAFNLNPLVDGTSALPARSMTTVDGSQYLTLTYTQNMFATDITYLPEVSTDLQTWNSGSGYVAPVSSTNNADTVTRTVVVRAVAPVGPTPGFMRLRVTKP